MRSARRAQTCRNRKAIWRWCAKLLATCLWHLIFLSASHSSSVRCRCGAPQSFHSAWSKLWQKCAWFTRQPFTANFPLPCFVPVGPFQITDPIIPLGYIFLIAGAHFYFVIPLSIAFENIFHLCCAVQAKTYFHIVRIIIHFSVLQWEQLFSL